MSALRAAWEHVELQATPTAGFEPRAELLSLLSLALLLGRLGLCRGHRLWMPDGWFPKSCRNLGAGPEWPLCSLSCVGPSAQPTIPASPALQGLLGSC